MMSTLSAVVIEKNAGRRFLFRCALRQKGYEVLTYRTRDEAEPALAERGDPQILLLDDPLGGSAYRILTRTSSGDTNVTLLGWNAGSEDGTVVREVLSVVESLPGDGPALRWADGMAA